MEPGVQELFEAVAACAARAIADVEAEKKEIAKLERPYREVARLYNALLEVVDADAIGPWFVTPNDAFERLKPLEVVESGEIDWLWEMVYRLRSGMPG